MNNKFKAIVNGWKNVVFRNEAIEQIAKDRVKICSTCENNHFNICIICNCPLIAKTRSELSNCPEGKWTKIN